MAQRIVTIEELRNEIREHGISRLARQLGCSRQHMQRVAGGQRQPGKRLLAKLKYRPVILYVDVMKPHDTQETPNQGA